MSPPMPPTIGETFGAVLISAIVIAILLGVLTVQTAFYYGEYRNDARWLKLWIAAVFVVHAAHLAVMGVLFYQPNISHFGNKSFQAKSGWQIPVTAALETSAEVLTQLYFARRSFVLNTGLLRWISAAGGVASIASFVMGIITAVHVGKLHMYSQYGEFWHVTGWFVGNVVTDILVTVPIAIALYSTLRQGNHFAATSQILYSLIVWIVSTGILTMSVQGIVLGLYFWRPKTFIFISASYVLASLYANSLLLFLNHRKKWDRSSTIVVYGVGAPTAPTLVNQDHYGRGGGHGIRTTTTAATATMMATDSSSSYEMSGTLRRRVEDVEQQPHEGRGRTDSGVARGKEFPLPRKVNVTLTVSDMSLDPVEDPSPPSRLPLPPSERIIAALSEEHGARATEHLNRESTIF